MLGLGQSERAIESFRSAFRAQREKRGHITDAHLDFGFLCISAPFPQLCDEALAFLDEFQYQSVFPVHIYRDAAIRALIYDCQGDRLNAQKYARAALSAAMLTRSPLPRHPDLGVVRVVDRVIQDRLLSIDR